jgi:hypothetical protein
LVVAFESEFVVIFFEYFLEPGFVLVYINFVDADLSLFVFVVFVFWDCLFKRDSNFVSVAVFDFHFGASYNGLSKLFTPGIPVCFCHSLLYVLWDKKCMGERLMVFYRRWESEYLGA